MEFLSSFGECPRDTQQQGAVLTAGCVSSGLMIFTTMVMTHAQMEVVSNRNNVSWANWIMSHKESIIIGHSILKVSFLKENYHV